MATQQKPGDPYIAEDDDHLCTDVLDTEDGKEVICQEPVGEDVAVGGGEYPDRDAPPQSPAPGAS